MRMGKAPGLTLSANSSGLVCFASPLLRRLPFRLLLATLAGALPAPDTAARLLEFIDRYLWVSLAQLRRLHHEFGGSRVGRPLIYRHFILWVADYEKMR